MTAAGGTATATATVSSIDPFVATVAVDGVSDTTGGAPQSMSTTIRCDISDHALTQAAATPEITAPPTTAPSGHLEVSIGAGAGAYSRVVDGPEVTCSFGL